MTYEIVSTDTTPFGSEFYLSTDDDNQEFQGLYSDFSDVYIAAESEFYRMLDDVYGDIKIPILGIYGAGELARELMSETDKRVYIGDYASEQYEEANFVEALNATQENTDWAQLVPDVEPGEPDSALKLIADLGRDRRVVVELSPRGVRYRLPRELGTYKGSRRDWQSMDTDEVAGMTLTELLDKIYEKLSE